mmetsp:Transcript_26730/g.53353  ORF Transcript_26730/g.53353 Transcript_26730/m.53353 type:complete len:1289 (+) Transcript_26730:191-4057(+)
MLSRWCPCPTPWEEGQHPDNYSYNDDYLKDHDSIWMDGAYSRRSRRIEDSTEEEGSGGKVWEMVYVGVVLILMFGTLLSDRIGADMVMLGALTLCMAARIISVEEGLSGFSNEGVLTVLVLFVVAAGIQVTGGLDWYMSKLLGRPNSIPSAQIRLMLPIALVSAFLNNTPVVVVMIPIVQKWGKNIGISQSQLLVPLSFASILGGTCTLIGTSTNLVVSGLLQDRYPNDPSMNIGLFDLGAFGVPVLFVGITLIVLASPYLLPGGKKGRKDETIPMDDGSILLGARLTKWSPAAGRSVKRSGLRDTGGIYLVSVYRASTGNVHRAVGQEFILNVDDILYFTGLIEEFGQFCEHHGLEVVTNESDVATNRQATIADESTNDSNNIIDEADVNGANKKVKFASIVQTTIKEAHGIQDDERLPLTIETTAMSPKSSLFSIEAEKMRALNRMRDMIRGYDPSEPIGDEPNVALNEIALHGPSKIVVVLDSSDLEDMVLVGINANDRPGLLLDISRGLHSLGLQLHHTEAAVIQDRSFSIWRCEVMNSAHSDADEIWSILSAQLESEGSVQAVKRRGLSVIRAIITEDSRLSGKCLGDVPFRELYKAAVIAIKKADKSETPDLSLVVLAPGDVMVLQANDDSPLLVRPPDDFYNGNKGQSSKGFLKAVTGKLSSNDLKSKASEESKDDGVKFRLSGVTKKLDFNNLTVLAPDGSEDSMRQSWGESKVSHDIENAANGISQASDTNPTNESLRDEQSQLESNLITATADTDAWSDMRVLFDSKVDDGKSFEELGNAGREYLMAMVVSPKSPHAKKTVSQVGLDKLSGLFLVQVERPTGERTTTRISASQAGITSPVTTSRVSVYTHAAALGETTQVVSGESITGKRSFFAGGSETGSSQGVLQASSVPVMPHEPLEVGDILWFAGPASAIADLRKIPGLVSFEDDELKQINEKVHDRRLVQAVVARKGPLVGKTAAEVGFRTRYGAAVIAVHRDGTRVQDHPGNIKLQAGDVLLLEAGPTFISRNTDNQQSFALISEVADSKPPRLNKLIPAVVLTVIMLAVVTAGVGNLLVSGLITAFIMGCMGIISQQEARDAVNWEVYITIASAFGIGLAMTNSGLAEVIANGLVWVGQALGIGHAGLYGAVYLATFLISNIVTNNAAAALMFPIALEAAESTGADSLLMSYNLMLAASASFMSPFGYTTNLLIYGPGGYKVKDFLYIGTPMQIVLWVLTTAILSNTTNPWYLSWIVTSSVFVLTLVVFVFPAFVKNIFKKANEAAHNVPGGDPVENSLQN